MTRTIAQEDDPIVGTLIVPPKERPRISCSWNKPRKFSDFFFVLDFK